MKKPGKLPQTVLGRSLRLMRGGAAILAKELRGRITSETKLETMKGQAEQLVATLGEMKGAAMKAGQILSMEASDLLPKEVLDILRQLHDAVPGMSGKTVRDILRKELGIERLAEVLDLSEEPIAAASIGQVHQARIKDQDVVLKVQFPGVAHSIDADLSALKKIAHGLLLLQGKDIQLDALFEELARGLRREVDYQLEADALTAYKLAFTADARYVIPDVLLDYSTKHVLTMSLVTGLKIKDWLETNPTPEERSVFCRLVLDLILREFFDIGLVQTDPNFGNFLYKRETQQLVLLDFGAVQEYPLAFREDYRKLVRTAMTGDRDDIIAAAIEMQLLDDRESYQTKALLADLVEQIVMMFDAQSQPFNFGDLNFLEEVRRLAFEFMRGVRFTPPPKQLAFLNRKLGGMYHLLKEAGCAIDMTSFLEQVVRAG